MFVWNSKTTNEVNNNNNNIPPCTQHACPVWGWAPISKSYVHMKWLTCEKEMPVRYLAFSRTDIQFNTCCIDDPLACLGVVAHGGATAVPEPHIVELHRPISIADLWGKYENMKTYSQKRGHMSMENSATTWQGDNNIVPKYSSPARHSQRADGAEARCLFWKFTRLVSVFPIPTEKARLLLWRKSPTERNITPAIIPRVLNVKRPKSGGVLLPR